MNKYSKRKILKAQKSIFCFPKKHKGRYVFAGVSTILILGLAVTVVLEYPKIYTFFQDGFKDKRPIETTAPAEFLHSEYFDENGEIINIPTMEDYSVSENYLKQKVSKDIANFSAEASNESINFNKIYLVNMFKDNPSKLNNEIQKFEIVFDCNNKKFVAEYTALKDDFPEGIDFDESSNLLDVVKCLQSCYLSNLFEASADEEKINYLKSNDLDGTFGNLIFLPEENKYVFPLISSSGVNYFSISEEYLRDNAIESTNKSIQALFSKFLKGENNVFTYEELPEYTSDLSAFIKSANNANSEDLSKN